MKKSFSIQLLILANLVPLAGVMFFGWSLFAIMLLFWLENVIIGIVNIFKIINAEGKIVKDKYKITLNNKKIEDLAKMSAIPLALFFCFHYGMFTFVHGVFIFALFSKTGSLGIGVLWGTLALMISHAYSYYANFIGKEEYKKLSRADVMAAPYKRVVVLHLTIIFGAFAASALGSPVFALVTLIFIKTLVDLWSHIKEHKI